MTDYDIERCREHKFFNLGNIIFYLIYLAVLIAAINEQLIDQLLDMSISSIWLGFLLINTKLYAFSPASLIIIYIIIAGIVGYHFYIIIPSVRKARQARVARARGALDFQRTTHSVKNHGYRFTTSYRLFFDRLMALMGEIVFDKMEIQREKERIVVTSWCGMNRSSQPQELGNIPLSTPGYSVPSLSSGSFKQPGSGKGRAKEKASSRSLLQRLGSLNASRGRLCGTNSSRSPTDIMRRSIPLHILAMRSTGQRVHEHKGDWVVVPHQADTDSEESREETRNIPVVACTNRRYFSTNAKEFEAKKEITSSGTEIILKRLLERHLVNVKPSSEMERRNNNQVSIFECDDSFEYFVLLSELFDLLRHCWDSYCPTIMILTMEERTEMEEQLVIWTKKSVRSDIFKDEKGDINENGMTFNIFAIWFHEILIHYSSIHAKIGTLNDGSTMIGFKGHSDSDSESKSEREIVTITDADSIKDEDSVDEDEIKFHKKKRRRTLEFEATALAVEHDADYVYDDDESCNMM